MPRQARIDAPGTLHHIICRGIERRQIFTEDQDRDDFVNRLSSILAETSTICYAWVLIPNHFHLLLRTGSTPISTVMKRLLTGYAVNFNLRHKRHGHLFQNRFKSIICQDDLYWLALVRYIHLNPLRANLVASMDELKSFRYSGHRALLGLEKQSTVAANEVWNLFSRNPAVAKRKYSMFLAEDVEGSAQNFSGGGIGRSRQGMDTSDRFQARDERILGDAQFVEEVLTRADEQVSTRMRYREQGVGLKDLVAVVARLLEITPEEVVSAGKQPLRVKARSLLCFWAVRELGYTATAVGERLDISQPAVSMAVQRGERLAAAQNWMLKNLIIL